MALEPSIDQLKPRIPKDDEDVVTMLKSPPPPIDKAALVGVLVGMGRADAVQLAVEQGVVAPDLPAFMGGMNSQDGRSSEARKGGER